MKLFNRDKKNEVEILEDDNNEIKDALEEEILEEIKNLRLLEIGGEEQQQAVESISKMTKLIIEMNAKGEEEVENKKDRKIKIILGAGSILLTAWQIIDHHVKWKELLLFEEKGSIVSSGGRNLLKEIFRIIK